MRSSYFLLFTLAAILPGLMLGAVLSRATLGTAAGPASVQSQGWPAPLEAAVETGVPSAPTGFDSDKFGTNPLTGSSEQDALAMLSVPQVGAQAPAMPPDSPTNALSGAPAPMPLPDPQPQAQPLLQGQLQAAPSLSQQRAPAPRMPAQQDGEALASASRANIDEASLPSAPATGPLALSAGLPEPLSLTPLQPLQAPVRVPQDKAKTDLSEAALPGQRGSAGDQSAGTLPEPVKLARLSGVASAPSASESGLAVAAPKAVAFSAEFDANAPESWLAGVESPDYRPPQFVLLSFEAASRNVFWDTSRELADEADAKVTYFISASSLILQERAESYATPTGEKGRAWLGFAKDRQELAGRLQRIQDAFAAGHDVAVQGVGYHRGQGWSIDQWRSELEQTEAFVRGAYRDNGLAEPEGWPAVAQHLLTGFRAREQSSSSSLEAALVARNQALYNASGKQAEATWPHQEQGLWQIGLPMLNLDGARRVLAQDYDFYLKQTNGQPNGAKSGDHEEQMLALLLAEFDGRYQGARAPMPVSLHFALWNKGAYWRAVKRFAKKVCGQPEVVCTTHRDLIGYLDALGQAKLARLAAADFPAYQGPGVRLETPKATGLNLPQIASLSKSPSLNDEQAASTAARLLSDPSKADTQPLSQASYVFDALPPGQGAPLPAIKPRRIARLAAPAKPTAVPAPPAAAQKQAAAPKQVDKPLPLPFSATTPSPSTGTQSSEPTAFY